MAKYGVPWYQVSKRSTTGDIKVGSGVLHGYYVNTAVATGTVTVTDGLSATLVVIPIGAAAGSAVVDLDIEFATKCTATFAGTGDISFIYL